MIRQASYPVHRTQGGGEASNPIDSETSRVFPFYISQPWKWSCTKGLAQGPLITGEKMFQAPLEPSTTCMSGHDKFSGTISDLKSKASFGCRGCSIVYDGLTTLYGPCSDLSNCTVDWKPRDKATLAVLVRHRCNLKYSSETPKAIEFLHNIGPFGT